MKSSAKNSVLVTTAQEATFSFFFRILKFGHLLFLTELKFSTRRTFRGSFLSLVCRMERSFASPELEAVLFRTRLREAFIQLDICTRLNFTKNAPKKRDRSLKITGLGMLSP